MKRPDLSRSKPFECHFVPFQAQGHSIYKVFEDLLEITTLSFANAKPVHDKKWEEREERYLQIIGKYNKNGLPDLFPKMIADIVTLIEDGDDDDRDILGEFFQTFVTGGENGQFFTPMHICRMMAQMTMNETVPDGTTVCDPACGSGRTLISTLEKNRNIVVTGCDLDRRCARMAAINLFLRGAKGQIYCMNSLSLEVYGGYRFGIRGGMIPYFDILEKEEIKLTVPQKQQIQNSIQQKEKTISVSIPTWSTEKQLQQLSLFG